MRTKRKLVFKHEDKLIPGSSLKKQNTGEGSGSIVFASVEWLLVQCVESCFIEQQITFVGMSTSRDVGVRQPQNVVESSLLGVIDATPEIVKADVRFKSMLPSICDDVIAMEDVKMDNPNITMEEYIRLEEEKAHRRGKVYNWETAKYVFNDTLTSEATLSCERTVSSLNDKIDFRISFDESGDEDCTVIFNKNSFSYKIIPVNNLITNSENNNDKVNMPSLPSPEPTVSCFDDLDFFNDLENEFPAIVYNDAQTSKFDDLDYFKDFENEFPAIVSNDAQTSKSDLLTKAILNPQHIDEFNLKDETSLFECDEEEQNV
ncbi:hypothetical protein Tco_0639396 [Tanacetum coccineum]